MARITKAQLEAQIAALNAQVAALQAQLAATQELLEETRKLSIQRRDAARTQHVAPAHPAPRMPNWQAERLAAMAQAKELAMRFGRSVKVSA